MILLILPVKIHFSILSNLASPLVLTEIKIIEIIIIDNGP
jgi:hypothetical protein